MHVLRQRVYIPSDGHYQSYIGEIQETTVPSGAEASIPIFGYCTEVSLLPVPVNQDMPAVDKWIPVGKIDAAQAETGIYIINKTPALVFKKEIIPTFRVSTAFTILAHSPDTSLTISWPGTNTPVGGILDISLRPDLFASLMERVWEYSDSAVTLIQQRNEVVTPYSSNRKKEREAIIQNVIWRYAALITGKKYDKTAFTTRIVNQFKLHAAVKDVPDLEKGALEEGIDQFWNIFIEAFEKAQLSSKIENKVARGLMVDITLVDSIAYPWSVIPLTDARMKPYYVPVVPIKHSSAVVPVIAGTASAGTLLVIALHNPSAENDCAFTAQLQTVPTSCGLPNGNVTLSHDTISQYQYKWSTGDTIQNLIGVMAGDYSVTITRVGTSCSQTLQGTVVNNNQPITESFITEDAHCGAEDGSIVVSVDPPGFYTYLWSTGSTDQNLLEVGPGTYTLTITAAGTCTDTAEATINALPPDFTIDLSSTPADCGAANGTASAVVTPEGSYTFQWSNGSTTPTINALPSGSYSVTVTPSETTCSIVKDIQVDDLPPAFQLTPLTTPASCGAMNGTAAVIVESPGEYQFLWSNGQTLQQITGLLAGNYEVTVTLTGTTCAKILTVTVPESTPSFTITPSVTPASCGQSDGTASVTVDPPGEYEYHWSNGDTTSNIQSLSAGTFTVTVSLPDSSCAQSIDIVVDQLPPAFTIDISSTPASCGVMDGTASVTINPPGIYDFVWSNQQSSSQITGLAAGDYTITVTLSGTQCSQVSHVTVDQLPPSFTVTISSTPANCGLADGTAMVIADPPGEYVYLWSNGQGTSQAIGLMTGNYSVTVSIAGTSCEISTSISVDQIPPSFNLSTSSSPSQCGMSNGVAAVEVFPAGEYTFQWSNGQSGSLITGLAPGDYIVMVSQAGSSCFLSDTVTVQQIPINLMASFQNTAAHCGLSDGSASISIDPQGTYTYSWDNGQTGSMLQQVPAGHYFVTVSDVSGCTATFTTSIDQLVAEYIEINSTSGGTCIGGGEITFTLSTPGPGPLHMDMMTPAGPSSIILPPGAYNLSAYVNVLPGSYDFNVWDESVGQTCLEHTSSAVADLTPALMVDADSYSTQSDQSVSGNVLQNDSGLNIHLTGTSAVVGGIVSSSGDGSFTYTPNPGFSGTGSFVYTVTDACGNSSTGLATITVIMISCNFTITSTLT
ncbi:MAG TPA: Ig-like domain-containing protein, partial [Saprospiraceae bacterium]|nr:Ig-like domain-containing protein [Saprospiraceae bacterium]